MKLIALGFIRSNCSQVVSFYVEYKVYKRMQEKEKVRMRRERFFFLFFLPKDRRTHARRIHTHTLVSSWVFEKIDNKP